MAESLVSVRLRAVNEQYNQEMARSAKATEELADTGGRSMAQLGADMTRVGGWMSTRVTLPILGVGAAALYTAGNFERGMNRVRGLTGATGDDFEALKGLARELGASTQYSASQAADAMGFLAMAGFEANEILGAMPSTLQLAAAGQLDLAQAADITTNILTGYGMEVEDLAHANDVLVKTFTSSNTSLEQLGEAMKYAGPVASSAGLEFEEAAAAIGLMGNAGIQGSMAGTSLRGALVRLLNPTSQVEAAMDRLGIEATNTDGSIKSMTEIVDQLEASGASTADMMLIFGQRAGPAMASLVSQGSGALEGLTQELREAEGTAEAVAGVNMEGFMGSLLLLKSAAEALLISIGESGLLDVATQLVSWLATGVQTVSELAPWVFQLASAFGLLLLSVGPIMSITGRLLTNWGSLVGGVQALGRGARTAATGLGNLGRSLGPAGVAGVAGVAALGIGVLTLAIQQSRQRAEAARQRIRAYAEAIEEAENAAEGAANALERVIRDTPRMARAFNDAGVGLDDFAAAALAGGDELDGLIDRMMAVAAESGTSGFELRLMESSLRSAAREMRQGAEDAEEIAKLLGETGDAAGGAIPALDDYEAILEEIGLTGEYASESIGEFGERLDSSGKIIEEWQADLVSGLESSNSALWNFSDEAKNSLDAFVEELMWNTLAQAKWKDNLVIIAERGGTEAAAELAKLGPEYAGVIDEIANATDEDFQRVMDQLEGAAAEGRRGVVSEFEMTTPEVQAAIEGMLVMVGGLEKRARKEGSVVGSAIAGGLQSGIDNAVGAVAATARAMVSTAVKSARNEAGIYSPSRVFAAEVGAPIAQGVAMGIDSGVDAPVRSVSHLIHRTSEVEPDWRSVSGVASPAPVLVSAGGGGLSETQITIDAGGLGLSAQDVETLADVVARRIGWQSGAGV